MDKNLKFMMMGGHIMTIIRPQQMSSGIDLPLVGRETFLLQLLEKSVQKIGDKNH